MKQTDRSHREDQKEGWKRLIKELTGICAQPMDTDNKRKEVGKSWRRVERHKGEKMGDIYNTINNKIERKWKNKNYVAEIIEFMRLLN